MAGFHLQARSAATLAVSGAAIKGVGRVEQNDGRLELKFAGFKKRFAIRPPR